MTGGAAAVARGRCLLAVAAVALGLLAPTGPAGAHPEAFLEYSVLVRFGAQGPEALVFRWLLDPEFSGALAGEARRHFASLEREGYLLRLEVGQVPVDPVVVRDVRARREGTRVVYTFTVPVRGASPAAGTLGILVEDPTDFHAVSLARRPVRVEAPRHYRVACDTPRDPQTNRPEGIRCSYRRLAP